MTEKNIVYIATNIINGKKYIGITCQGLSQRKSKHKFAAKSGSNTIFAKAIRKYGLESFNFTIFSECSTYELAKLEEIKLISTINPEYNLTMGGEGCLGYRHTEESKNKMSNASKGRIGFWKGKKLPSHVVELQRQRCKDRPDKLKVLALGPKSQQRAVICETDENRFFESVNSCSKFYGHAMKTVISACKTKKPLIRNGRSFSYLDEWCPNSL